MIIAVSGDGVYNEVVNGVLDVSGTEALAAVAAGGNANDHRRSTRRMPLVDAIVAAHATGRPRHLDLLRLTVRSADRTWNQYAHSYIGFGLTPLMAVGLKRDRKGTIAELVSVLRTFTSSRRWRSSDLGAAASCTTVWCSPTWRGWPSTVG